MRLCKSIIQRYSGECDVTGVKNSFSFFLDMAELWEAYLLKVLQRHLTGTGYVVYSPNAEDEEWLVSGQRRRIRPDLVIEREKDGVSVAVLDAKFKYYQEIGQIERGGVSRDDLYQMVTYIYHYASADSPFLGMFVSPCEATGQNNIHPMTSNPKHCISVANLDITRWDDTKFDSKKMDESEETFVKELRKHLY
jgi:5-methylcytosine-specific restriction endonuclease McrBC regulatory subunit McrC